MKHGLVKPRYTLAMYDEAKVQALLESRPSDNVRKDPKYLTQRARLGPQTPYKNRPHTTISLDAHSEPSSSPILQGHAARPLVERLMTLDIGNDMLLCKVFPASLQGQALSWFHRLPANSIDNFRDLFEVFVGQYLCSARHKQNISTLQNIKMQENETLREFVKRFRQVVLQVESYSMDAILQIFKRSICLGTLFFESLAKKPPISMDDLFRHASKYSMLEDDVRAATQQVLVVGQAARSEATKSFKAPNHHGSSNRGQDE
ncbi:hypothetical protein VitviT2T_005584 [Vitis vinifera]|uniref:Ig-like domain-containing protein n=1 Tax=Vitis vinifera TaxID=29760 RepID=A0ABY9BV09_VITVI|nr:hypothetical protein VitviT2T_005584 [Vitis vinifera]